MLFNTLRSFRPVSLFIALVMLFLARQAEALSYLTHYGNQSTNCNGQAPSLVVGNDFVLGEDGTLAVVAPIVNESQIEQTVYLIGAPIGRLNTTGTQILPGLTAHILLGAGTNTFAATTTRGVARFRIPVPHVTSLIGQEFVFQAFHSQAGCASQQFSASNAISVKIRARGSGAPGTIPTTLQSSASFNGITVTFATPYQVGAYENGEPFIIEPPNTPAGIQITSISPQPTAPNNFLNQYIRVDGAGTGINQPSQGMYTPGSFRIGLNGAFSSPITPLYPTTTVTSAMIATSISNALTSIGLTTSDVSVDLNGANFEVLIGINGLRYASTGAPVNGLLTFDSSNLPVSSYTPGGVPPGTILSRSCIRFSNAAIVNPNDPDGAVFVSGHPGGTKPDTGPNCGYLTSLNKGTELMSNGVIFVKAGETLVTSKSHMVPAVITISASAIEKFAPFSVVATAPDIGTFMPPQGGDIKFELNRNDANMNLLASLALPAGTPAYDVPGELTLLRTLMYNHYYSSGYAYRQMSAWSNPTNQNAHNYGGIFHLDEGRNLLAINTNLSTGDKRSILNLLTGWAINWYGENLTFWGSRASNGGQQSGDVATIYIGYIYNHIAMMNRIINGRNPGIYDQVIEVTPSILATPNLAYPYTQADIGLNDFKMSLEAPPVNSWSTAVIAYKFCCTMVYWNDSLFAARVMGITNKFRNPGVFRYMMRYLNPAINPNTSNMYASPQIQPLLQAYGASYPVP